MKSRGRSSSRSTGSQGRDGDGPPVQEQLSNAVTALRTATLPSRSCVLDREKEVNQFENRIDAAGIETLAATAARLRPAADHHGPEDRHRLMERIGDHGSNIAERAPLYLSGQPQLKAADHIPLMAEARRPRCWQEAVDALRPSRSLGQPLVPQPGHYIDELRSQISRAPHLHRRRPLDHRPRHAAQASSLRPGARRRPRDQHRRDVILLVEGRP